MSDPLTRYYASQSEEDLEESLFGLSDKHPGLAWTLGWDQELAYHTRVSLGSREGFPDWCLAHPTQNRLLVVELKREIGQPNKAQRRWLEALGRCGPPEVHVWRPSDLERITAILRGEEA